MTEVRAIGDRINNAQLMADCHQLGYLDGPVLDATYGTGRFWKGLDDLAIDLTTNDLNPDAVTEHHHDFTALPFDNNSFATAVFDAPYKLNGTSTGIGASALDNGYGVGGTYRTVQSIHTLMRLGLIECGRVAARYVLAKCQDQVVSGRVHWQTIMLTETGYDYDLNLVDMLHVQGYRKQPEGRRQLHARRDYSTLLVFEVGL